MHLMWAIFVFLFGACVGSFLNVVIYRLPRGQSIAFPPSHCPKCGRGIRWYDNIPMLSWLMLRARCRFCKEPISPRYIIIELVTALLVTGLYLSYYAGGMRSGAGELADTWPMFISHALLVCGLLACAMVDIDTFTVPLEVCWFNTIVALLAAAIWPGAFADSDPTALLPRVSATTGAMALAAAVGLAVSIILVRQGVLQQSFLDASDKPLTKPEPQNQQQSRRDGKKKKGRKGKNKKPSAKPVSVAMTTQHGVNPRREMLREMLFLAPPVGLAVLAWLLVAHVEPLGRFWNSVAGPGADGWLPRHMAALLAALFGYLVGGAWIWGTRILGTLAFGKEAMGMGDVHILAAVGAVTGYLTPSLVFFIAPFFGLIWALVLLIRRNQRELPYGPWLAAATLVVMALHGPLMKLLEPYKLVLEALTQ